MSLQDPRSGKQRPGATVWQLRAWALYDLANQAFVTPIQSFIFAAYFTNAVAANPTLGTTQWGNMVGLSGILIALGGPLLGAMADRTGRRKPWLGVFTLLCILCTGLLWYVAPSPDFVWLALLLVGVGTIASEYSQIFYNAMLPELAPPDRQGRWSGWGWATGYFGGIVCLAAGLFLFIGDNPLIPLSRDGAYHIRATNLLAAGWYFLFAIPLFLFTPDAPATGAARLGPVQAAREGVRQLAGSLRHARRHRHILRFLVARTIYNEALSTTFVFGGIYAAGSFGMSTAEVLTFGIAMNVSAGLGAFCFAWVDDAIGPRKTILLSLLGLVVPGAAILLVHDKMWFWVFGLLMSVFFGPVQAASRTWLARSAPEALRTQFFGLFALSGKITSFMGPLAVAWLTAIFDSQRVGMSCIIVFLVVGGVLMLGVPQAGLTEEEEGR